MAKIFTLPWRALPAVGLILVALSWIPGAGAVQLQRLYEAEVPAADQTAAERDRGLRAALAEVLVRISGDRGVLDHPAVSPLLASPGRYVQQYRYQQVPEDGESPAAAPWLLWTRFDAAGLEHALRDRGLPYWGQERPETLVWLAVEKGGQRALLAEPDDSEVKAWVQAAAARRGLPLVFPLMDLEDRTQVKFTDVWGGFMGPLLMASERYRPQALLIGRVHQGASGGWSATWMLMVQGTEQRWSASETRLDAVAAQLIDRAADQLASVFAIRSDGGASEYFTMTVDGVDSIEDYARLTRYFDQLSAVTSVQLVSLDGKQAEYRLQLQGDVSAFEQALAFGGVVARDDAAMTRLYRLQP